MVGTAQTRLCPPYGFKHCCGHSSAISPRVCASFVGYVLPSKVRGRREYRVHDAPAASRANEKSTRASHHRYAETVRHSLRDGATTYFVLSPVTGLFCHRRSRGSFHKNLTPASGR